MSEVFRLVAYNYVLDLDSNMEYEIPKKTFDIPQGLDDLYKKLNLDNILCLPSNYDYDDNPILNSDVFNRFESAYVTLKHHSLEEFIPKDSDVTQIDVMMFVEEVLDYLVEVHNSNNPICRLRLSETEEGLQC